MKEYEELRAINRAISKCHRLVEELRHIELSDDVVVHSQYEVHNIINRLVAREHRIREDLDDKERAQS
jgi:hypothetical protein